MKKRNIIVFIIIAIILFISYSSVTTEDGESLSPNDYCRIVDMDYKAVVVDEPDSKGKIVVTERITFDVHAASASNGFWELWRDLCEDYVDGVKVHYKVNSVKQILSDGTEVVWPESPKLYWDDSDYESWNTTYGPGKWYHSPGPYNESYDRYECVFFYVDNLYREKITFEIEYEMYNAVLRYGDCSDLYIAMYSGDTTKYLESFNAEILISNKDMPKQGNYKATTYGTNAGSFPIKESATKNPGYYTFSFNLSDDELKFKKYNEYIEFDLVAFGEDKHIFAENASTNHYSNDDVLDEILEEQEYYANAPQRYKEIKTKVLIGCVIVAGFILLIVIIRILKLKHKYPNSSEKTKNEIYRDIPSDLDPKFANALVFCKDKNKKDDGSVYSALLLSLARKNYIKIHESSRSDVMIIINEPKSQPVDAVNVQNNINEVYETNPIIENDGEYGSDGIYRKYNDVQNINQENRTYEPPADQSGRVYESFGTTYDNDDAITHSKARVYESSNALYSNPESAELLDHVTKNSLPQEFENQESIIKFEDREPLTICEKYYLNLIKHHAKDGNIRMDTLQHRILTDYDYTRDFAKNIEKSVIDTGINYGYIQKANWLAPQKELAHLSKMAFVFGVIFALINLITRLTPLDFAFGGFILLSIVCFITGIYLKTQSHKYVLLTEFGETEYKKWRGLYNFLKSDTLINEKTVIELPLWEKYLVYATAFGISEKVIQAIKIRCPDFTATESIIGNSYCHSGRIHSSGRRFYSSVRSGSHRGSYGGYGGSFGGGGFGYGGGGRGGGGGGGGH